MRAMLKSQTSMDAIVVNAHMDVRYHITVALLGEFWYEIAQSELYW